MSSICERFIFDICSPNPSQCKNCKNNKSQHAEPTQVKREQKIVPQLKITNIGQAQTTLQQKVEQNTKQLISTNNVVKNLIVKENVQQQPSAKIASAKPIEETIQVQVQNNGVELKPNKIENDPQRKVSVLQLIKEREEKLKQQQQTNLDQYSSTPRKDTQLSNTNLSSRQSVASASHSNCSGDTPISQRYIPQSNFSSIASQLKDQKVKIEVNKADEESASIKQENNLQTTNKNDEQKKQIDVKENLNANVQSSCFKQEDNLQETNKNDEQKKQIDEKDNQQKILEEEKEKQMKQEQENEAKLKLEKEIESKLKLEKEMEAKQKQEKEREEQQRLEKEKLTANLQKQSQENNKQKEEKPKPINSNKGLTLAEILAKQKEKIESNNPPQKQAIEQAQTPHKNLFTQLNKIEQQGDKQNTPKPLQIKSIFLQKQSAPTVQTTSPPSNTVQKVEVESTVIPNPPTQIITSIPAPPPQLQNNIPTPPVQQNDNKVQSQSLNPINSIIKEKTLEVTQKQEDLKQPQQQLEQKPLGLVALRKLELEKQKQQQQQNQTPTNKQLPQPLKSGLSLAFQVNKKEEKINTPPINQPLNQIQQGTISTQADTPLKEQKEQDNVKICNTQDSPDNNTEIKKPSLVSQLKSQLGNNIKFGLAIPPPPPAQTKVESTLNTQEKDNNLNDIISQSVTDSKDNLRESQQEFIERPMMRKNFRSSRKVVLDEDSEE